MAFADYAKYDGIGLGQLVAKKKVTALELVDEAIARIERHNPRLNAVVYKTFDQARAAAKKKLPDGPFKGVPFLLKDIMAFQTGVPTRQGSGFIPDAPGDHDSAMTRRFTASGLISLGKTNVPEFGLLPVTELTLYGPARNPWNPEHTPGGSSGGSAAAVAAGIVPLAHANDGGGSIRIPASSCGLVGLKPTRARVSTAPDLGDIMGGLTADNVVSRTVRDSAAALDALAGPEPGDPYWAPPQKRPFLKEVNAKPGKLKIAFATRNLSGQSLHADCVTAVTDAAKLCKSLGHRVEEAAPQINMDLLAGAFMPIWASGVTMLLDSVAMMTGRAAGQQDVQGLTWGLYQYGKTVTASQYMMCQFLLQQAARQVATFHEKYDVWLTATLGAPPLKVGAIDTTETDWQKAFAPVIDYVPFTALQNATGQPAINLPLHWNADGLPIGTQFVGRFGDEATLLRLAGQIEKAAPWKDKRPPIWN